MTGCDPMQTLAGISRNPRISPRGWSDDSAPGTAEKLLIASLLLQSRIL